MDEGSGGESLREVAERESALIDAHRGRIAGFERFPGMKLVGLAWTSSSGPDAQLHVDTIDALYLNVSAPVQHADVAVRTWLHEPSAREEFSLEPYVGTHVRDFMLERKGGEFDFEF